MKGYNKELDMKKLIKSLAAINCFYNHKPEDNGHCYSSKCMFNQDPNIGKQIKNKGCTIFKNIVKNKDGIFFMEEE